jgi:hypothetical protein
MIVHFRAVHPFMISSETDHLCTRMKVELIGRPDPVGFHRLGADVRTSDN